MWFIADIFERYTTSVAKTFVKLAAQEAEANRRALDEIREKRRQRAILAPERQLTVPAALVTRPTILIPDAAEVKAIARAHEPAADSRPDPRDAKERVALALATLPAGVRGDVVARWIETFAAVRPGRDALDLIERLRKDKKVRVPELQVIAADVLDEEPTFRKKDEHLDALRRHLARPAAPSAAARTSPIPQHV